MKLVPMGSFTMKVYESNTVQRDRVVSVQTFYASEEITNKQYREFVNYVLTHKNDSIGMIDLALLSRINRYEFKLFKDSLKKLTHRRVKDCLRYIKYSSLTAGIIDTLVWEKEFANDSVKRKKYKNYFRDKKFDNYPVVGVSYENAKNYCLWLSQMENKKREAKGLQVQNDFRLPTEAEWAYLASANKGNETARGEIVPVTKGKEKAYGVHGISANISEWTSTVPEIRYSFVHDLQPDYCYEVSFEDVKKSEERIVLGGNWKEGANASAHKKLDKKTTATTLGFRVVMTYTSFSEK